MSPTSAAIRRPPHRSDLSGHQVPPPRSTPAFSPPRWPAGPRSQAQSLGWRQHEEEESPRRVRGGLPSRGQGARFSALRSLGPTLCLTGSPWVEGGSARGTPLVGPSGKEETRRPRVTPGLLEDPRSPRWLRPAPHRFFGTDGSVRQRPGRAGARGDASAWASSCAGPSSGAVKARE